MKIKLSNFAKDLNINADDLLHLFYEKGDVRKKASSAITKEEADWILEKLTKDNMVDSFDDYFHYSRRDNMYKRLHTGELVTGLIFAVNNSEIIVDCGTIHTGYIHANNLTKPISEYSVGDWIKAVVNRVCDADGSAMLIEEDYYRQREEIEKQNKQQRNSSIVNEVMSQVQENLTQMKPALISEIAISVYSQLEKGVSAENAELKKKVSELEERVKYLETMIDILKM